jgi:DNA-directed RNA polymerase specialized sigma54-like protein
MAFLENRLVVKATQKTTITPGLVQMVNLLALNKVELVDMIALELAENPVLEEATEIRDDPPAEPAAGETAEAVDADDPYEVMKQREGTESSGTEAGEEGGEDPLRDFDLQEFERYLLCCANGIFEFLMKKIIARRQKFLFFGVINARRDAFAYVM